jgi:transglutaminase-like putative cysteine protease
VSRAGDGSARPGATFVAVLAVCLAATSLHAVLQTESWYWPSVLAAVVVAGVSLTARALRVPIVLQPLLALAGLLLVLTGLYASGPALAGFLPTAGSLRTLGTLSSNGVNSLDALLAPTPATTQLKVLCVAAVGLMALSVDLIAVGGRRPAYAGIPLVLLIAVPSAIRERSVGFASLLAAVLGFLLLLTLDNTDRTSRWGRLLPGPDGGRGPAASGTAGPALRIGAAAIVAALLIPQLIPGARTSRFSAAGSGNGAGRGGGGTVVVVDPFVSVANELTEEKDETLLTVSGTVPTYQRITALEDFTDKGFSLGTSVTASAAARVSKGLPVRRSDVPSQQVTEKITGTSEYAQNLLPLPEDPTAIKISGDWRLAAETTTVFSADDTTRGKTWTVQAALPQPTVAQLEAGGGLGGNEAYAPELQVDLQLPADLPSVLAATAMAWTAGATTAYQAAVDIQRHFTDGTFAYDTTVAYDGGPQGFADFLAARRGFCEQYATTMAAMLRTLGIPARVAIGFTAGIPNATRTSWTVTGADAHAWPEVWFSGVGWVRFEPTPLSGGRAITPSYTQGGGSSPVGPTTAPSTAPTTAPSASRSAAGLPGHKAVASNSDDSTPPPAVHGSRGHVQWWVVVAVVVLVLLVLPVASDRITRRRRLRPEGSPELVWEQLLDDAADRLVPVPASDSPRAAGRRIRAALARTYVVDPAVSAAIDRIVTSVEQSRYAVVASDDDLRADERTVRQALSRGLPLRQRLAAEVLPATALMRLRTPLARTGEWATSGFDQLARLVSRRAAQA